MFVCTGNTCRSPMAAGIAKKYIKKNNITGLKITSAGLSPNQNDRVTDNAVSVMSEIKIYISEHVASGLSYQSLADVDIFVPMTEEHKSVLIAAGVDNSKIITFARPVTDPFYGDIYDYRRCRDQLLECVPSVIEKILDRVDS